MDLLIGSAEERLVNVWIFKVRRISAGEVVAFTPIQGMREKMGFKAKIT
jgi:hypothetical protein